MSRNRFTPTAAELRIAARLASRVDAHGGQLSVADIASEIAHYREQLIRPLIGRALAQQSEADAGKRTVMCMSRGDCFDVINRARGKQ